MKRLFSLLLVLCLLAGLMAFPAAAHEQEPVFGEVSFWRLVLKENIGIRFQMSFTDEILEDEMAYVEITLAGEVTKYPVSGGESVMVNVAPAQMTEEIKICIVSGEGVSSPVGVYSVKAYADRILSGEYDSATKDMVKAMLTYGAMAQKFFGIRTEILANDQVDFALADVPAAEADVNIQKGAEGISFYGASLRYESRLALRYYLFADDISRYTFAVNGKVMQPVEKEGMYFMELEELLPQELDDYFVLSAEDGAGGSLKVIYNPVDYICRMYHAENTPEATRDLLQALYTYHLTAKNYAI